MLRANSFSLSTMRTRRSIRGARCYPNPEGVPGSVPSGARSPGRRGASLQAAGTEGLHPPDVGGQLAGAAPCAR